MKYVRLFHPIQGDAFFFTLAPVSHRELAERHADRGKPVSAAFVRFDEAYNATTYGTSESLKLSPQPDDAELISTFAKLTAENGAPAQS
jgi:hypothetical protein